MKLIIDIHEDCLEELKNIELNESNEGVVFHTICCVRNGTPLEEELEKIKAEIQEQIDFFKKIESFANAYGLEIANGIIKCRIAELKGENK